MATENLHYQEFRLRVWAVDEISPHTIRRALIGVIDPETEGAEIVKAMPDGTEWPVALGQPAPVDQPTP